MKDEVVLANMVPVEIVSTSHMVLVRVLIIEVKISVSISRQRYRRPEIFLIVDFGVLRRSLNFLERKCIYNVDFM